jgi:hypothetical protein
VQEGRPAGILAPAETVRKKRGPEPDYETASRVAEIVARTAPDRDWRSKLDDICDVLDEESVKQPKTWKVDGCRSWSGQLAANRKLVVKAIEHHLSNARRKAETLS